MGYARSNRHVLQVWRGTGLSDAKLDTGRLHFGVTALGVDCYTQHGQLFYRNGMRARTLEAGMSARDWNSVHDQIRLQDDDERKRVPWTGRNI